MKTVGERIQQARRARGLSGEALAKLVGYKTQSGIANLESRATGSGGNKIAAIAKALDVSVAWVLNGPDVDDASSIPPYESSSPQAHAVRERSAAYKSSRADIRAEAHALIDTMDEKGLLAVIPTLRLLTDTSPAPQTDSSGLPAAAHPRAA